MSRIPVVLTLLALALVGLAWWVLADGASPENGEGEAESPHAESASAAEVPSRPALAGSPAPRVAMGEWRGLGVDGNEVSGRVVDGADEPVAGLTVRLLPTKSGGGGLPGPAEVRTRSDGTFRFAGLAEGRYRLFATYPDRVDVDREVRVPTTDLVLRLADAVILAGYVRAADGSGVADAAVHLRLGVSGDSRRLSTVTDREGWYRFQNVSYAGQVGLAADAGVRGRVRGAYYPWRRGRLVDLELDPPQEVVTTTVRVVEVRKDGSLRPLEGARLRWRLFPVTWDDALEWREVTTGVDGTFSAAMTVGERVEFEPVSLPPDVAPFHGPAWTFTVKKDLDVLELRVAKLKRRTIGVSALVQDFRGQPVPGAEIGWAQAVGQGDSLALQRVEGVKVEPWPARRGGVSSTDATGRFAFQITLGPWDRSPLLFVRAPDFLPVTLALPRDPQDVLDTTVVLYPSAVLVGRVLDDVRAPVRGAAVSLSPSGRSPQQLAAHGLGPPHKAITAADGTFRIEGLAIDRYLITLHAPEGPLGAKTEVDVARAQTRALDLLLRRGGEHFGLVVDEDDTPVGNAKVHVRSTDGLPEHAVWTDGSGRFRIRGLARGRNHVTAQAAGFRPWSGPDQFLPVSDPLRIVLDRGEEARGTVVDALGQPIPWARVLVSAGQNEDGGDAEQVATCNGRGVFTLSGLARPSRFLATAPGHAFLELTWHGTQGPPRLAALAPGALAGRVLDADGQPVTGATVSAVPRPLGVRATAIVSNTKSLQTDAAGRFRLEPLYAEFFDVQVHARGGVSRFGPYSLGHETLELRLEAPR